VDERRIEVLTEEALEALERGDHVRAVAISDQLIAELPEDALVRNVRARGLLMGGAAEEAVEEAGRAVELAPENATAHNLLGVAAWRAGKLTQAQASLEEAVRLSGGNAGMLTDYAWFMAAERGPRPAEDAALEAVAVAAKSSTAWAALGLAQLRLHRRDEAQTSLRRALRLDPNDPYAQYAMARLLHDRRQDAPATALADLLADTPGTEQIVADMRQQAKQRQVARMLVERGAYPAAVRSAPWYRAWIWLAVAVAMIVVLLLLLKPVAPLAIFVCTFVPLFVFWLVRFLD